MRFIDDDKCFYDDLESGCLSPTANSEESQNIPHAVPVPPYEPVVIFAEVVAWEPEQPTFQQYFGHRESFSTLNESQYERPVLFSSEDKGNPLRCVCKLLGVMLALPLYIIYYIVFHPLEYVPAIFRCLDLTVFRMFGLIIDAVVYIISVACYWIYILVLRPLYILVVLLKRVVVYIVYITKSSTATFCCCRNIASLLGTC
jgi:hypothetical protein